MEIKEKIAKFYKDYYRVVKIIWEVDKKLTLLTVLLQIVQAILPVGILYITKQLIERLTTWKGAFSEIILLILVYALAQLALALSAQFYSYVQTIQQQKLTDKLMEDVLLKAIEVNYDYYENPVYHDTLHLAQQQSLYRIPQLLTNLSSLIQNSLSVIFLLGFFLTLHVSFSFVFLLLCFPLAAIKWYYGMELHKLEKGFAPIEREANYLYQSLTGVNAAKEVRIFGFGNSFIAKFHQIRKYVRDEKKKTHLKLTIYGLFAEAFEILAMSFLFYFLAKQTWTKTLTIGVFVIYLQGFQRLQSTTKQFLQSLVQMIQLRIFLKDFFLFFDIPITESKNSKLPFPTILKGLELVNISFTYPQTNKQVLHGINLSCKPGQIIAIVGENGCGKSTLVKILAGLYQKDLGEIYYDSINANQIDSSSFRENSVFLFQDFEKYFFTVEENIALANTGETISEHNIKRAAQLSGADSFITKLSKGYKTRMGRLFEGSEQLSGGQWQKLALARMFYKKAQLVVLDEPTSSLDANAELELFSNVFGQLEGKMVIIISHRLYNLKMADRIYVMHDGRIAEEGSFQELVSKNGIFNKMYEAQKL